MQRTKRNAPLILANDPSLTGWGWVVIQPNGMIIDVGCIRTEPQAKKRRIRKGDDIIRRIHELNTALLRVIRKYRIDYIISELPHGSQTASAATMIGIVSGIAQTLSDTLEIPIEWYSENDAKKEILGKNSATKAEVKEAVDAIFDKVPWTNKKYKDEAIADALAIFAVAWRQSPFLMFHRRQ